MALEFIELSLGSHTIVHGFDETNKEITETVSTARFSKKMVALSRIKSVSEKYILTDYTNGRWIYWEYEGGFENIKKQLSNK